jgi:hypothetical protein
MMNLYSNQINLYYIYKTLEFCIYTSLEKELYVLFHRVSFKPFSIIFYVRILFNDMSIYYIVLLVFLSLNNKLYCFSLGKHKQSYPFHISNTSYSSCLSNLSYENQSLT